MIVITGRGPTNRTKYALHREFKTVDDSCKCVVDFRFNRLVYLLFDVAGLHINYRI